VLVTVLGTTYALDLLPSLCDGMFDDDWRIRASSLSLLGELLYLIGDTKAVGLAEGEDEEEDDAYLQSTSAGANRVTATLRAHIGDENADEVLAALYIVRSDVSMTGKRDMNRHADLYDSKITDNWYFSFSALFCLKYFLFLSLELSFVLYCSRIALLVA
jgi:hypothetical protein